MAPRGRLDRHTKALCLQQLVCDSKPIQKKKKTETLPFPRLMGKLKWISSICEQRTPNRVYWIFLGLGRGPPQVSAGATTRVDGGASRFPIADPVSDPSARWWVRVSARPCVKLEGTDCCPCLRRRLQTQITPLVIISRNSHGDDWRRFLCVCYIQLIWMLVPS